MVAVTANGYELLTNFQADEQRICLARNSGKKRRQSEPVVS